VATPLTLAARPRRASVTLGALEVCRALVVTTGDSSGAPH
jgi:hypothetical protein